ncbi:MAG: D-alanine--D-alanine ligase [Nitrospirota bacterium]|nr:D-alanine--D-alanine ligase [Nitrospirota bacterium]
MKSKKIAVLMGGLSAEREISFKTGKAVERALQNRGYETVAIDAGRDLVERLWGIQPDAVFIALHGKYGEDGIVQGVLELMGIPYGGSGVLASAIAMDKAAAKKIMLASGIPTAPFAEFSRETWSAADEPELPFPYPAVVKPVCEGSAIGVTIVDNAGALRTALENGFKNYDRLMAEAYVDGRELTVGILDDTALPVVEIIPVGEFYDFGAKYTAGMSRHLVPADIDAETASRMQDVALRLHKAIGCRGATRVDIRLDRATGTPMVLEINTIPGMTETSLLPEAAASAGISFDDLVERILQSAFSGERIHA